MQTYQTIQEAAIAGLSAAMRETNKTGWEYLGFVVKTEGGFTYTEPKTSKLRTQVDNVDAFEETFGHQGLKALADNNNVAALEVVWRGKCVSMFHTHPNINEMCSWGSGNDAIVAMNRRQVQYLGCQRDMGVYELDPEKIRQVPPYLIEIIGWPPDYRVGTMTP